MIGVIDYGAGNLRSVTNALDHLGLAWTLVGAPDALDGCSRLVLPGVGHFGAAMQRLNAAELAPAVQAWGRAGKPLLGVCLGAQLLLDGSEEAPGAAGLGLIAGRVVKLGTKTIPHMGWNRVCSVGEGVLFDESGGGSYFYFAHSFVCEPADEAHAAAVAECDGRRFCVAVQRGRVCGVQFHPEKSAAAGLELLRRFAAC